MRWERFFEDLEHQLDSEWEAERAALDTEAERLRIARLTLRERMHALVSDGSEVSAELPPDTVLHGRLTGVGADWISLDTDARRGGAALVPLPSLVSLSAPEPDVLRSARAAGTMSPLLERMTFGFVLRDLVRRRRDVRVHTVTGRVLDGTIDRAGADHLDLALHDAGAPRRSALVSGHRLIPFPAVAWVRMDAATS